MSAGFVVSHYDLSAIAPAEARVSLRFGDCTLWERVVAIPNPAAVYGEELESACSVKPGGRIFFHVHNHGQNNWQLQELSALRWLAGVTQVAPAAVAWLNGPALARFGLSTILVGSDALALAACGSTSSSPHATAGSGSGGTGNNAGGGGGVSGETPTWHGQVAPIVSLHCQGCHQEGGIALFGLQTYEQAKMWSKALPGIVAAGQMPPFLAAETVECQPRFGFKDDPRLTPEKLAVLDAWAAAGAQNHTETMRLPLGDEGPPNYLWAVGTHMHYVGTDMRIGITRAAPGTEPAEECLLQTPDWGFNWQRGYLYDVPIARAPTLRGGDVIDLRCTYDNSMQNPFVAQALQQQGLTEPRDVGLGEATLDEMCLGVFGIAQKVSELLQ